jgi:uncharacterized protein (DUF58 family)
VLQLLPGRRLIAATATLACASTLAMLFGLPQSQVGTGAAIGAATLAVTALLDLGLSLHMYRQAPLRLVRTLPHAFALGVAKVISLDLVNEGTKHWQVRVQDAVDEKFSSDGLPQAGSVPAQGRLALRYSVTPLRRGLATWGHTFIRWRTRAGLFEIGQVLGEPQRRSIYPNFAALIGYAWLAGDRRLAQIGIKTYAQRGQGTDFRQLAEYQRGDPIRHIDWKATMRQGKAVVRQFQDERDQCVIFLLDCGRRMRADEGSDQPGSGHFDQVLNALMLLSYVALKEGDEVGALTFGNPAGQERHFAPRKGAVTFNALMNSLYDLEPSTTHSDYMAIAERFTRVHHKRALVIVLTNFRDEDAFELTPAIALLRKRNLVMVASLRERVLRQIAEQALPDATAVAESATAHMFEQARRDAFARTLGHDPLSLDVEPDQLATGLVNRYHAIKRAGLL